MKTRTVELRNFGISGAGAASNVKTIWKLLEDEERANPGYNITFRANYRTGMGTLTYTKKIYNRVLERIDDFLRKRQIERARRIVRELS